MAFLATETIDLEPLAAGDAARRSLSRFPSPASSRHPRRFVLESIGD